ncbi:MAG TPA: hypothetical protein VJJ28_01585 [Candidatus Paceibacterota bacterium]
MIRHTLLPDSEIRLLRREYRIRLLIIALFFISCATVIGILALFPAFMSSYLNRDEDMSYIKELEKNRQANGVMDKEKELIKSQNLAKRIIEDKDSVIYSEIIQKIILRRTKNIQINSFELSYAVGTSTPVEVIIQGKAMTREALMTFKKGLEGDIAFSKVELPVSDLAKNKDISFALRLIAGI